MAKGIDIRTTGGYVLVEPSIVNGEGYKWLPGKSPEEIGFADAPEWLVKLLQPEEREIVVSLPQVSSTSSGKYGQKALEERLSKSGNCWRRQ